MLSMYNLNQSVCSSLRYSTLSPIPPKAMYLVTVLSFIVASRHTVAAAQRAQARLIQSLVVNNRHLRA